MKRLLLGAFVAMIGLASAEEGRPLSMETIDRVIERQDRAVQACRKGARRDTLLQCRHRAHRRRVQDRTPESERPDAAGQHVRHAARAQVDNGADAGANACDDRGNDNRIKNFEQLVPTARC